MLQRIAMRLRDEDKGFTLIELMVVVLIIGILIAIAIPTFLGARQRAQDRAAQSSDRNALTNAKAIFTDNEDYTAANVAALTAAEPSLQFVADAALVAADAPTKVSVLSPNANTFIGVVRSKSGTCFAIRDIAVAGAGQGTMYSKGSAAANCQPSTVPAASWAASW